MLLRMILKFISLKTEMLSERIFMEVQVRERVRLTHELLVRNMSDTTIEAVAKIMESMRKENDYRETEAEVKAKEIRELIETGLSEKLLLEKLK